MCLSHLNPWLFALMLIFPAFFLLAVDLYCDGLKGRCEVWLKMAGSGAEKKDLGGKPPFINASLADEAVQTGSTCLEASVKRNHAEWARALSARREKANQWRKCHVGNCAGC